MHLEAAGQVFHDIISAGDPMQGKRPLKSGDSHSSIDKETAIAKVVAKEVIERKTTTQNIRIEFVEDLDHGWLIKVGFFKRPRQTFIGSSNYRFVDKEGQRVVWLDSRPAVDIEALRRFGTRDVSLPAHVVTIWFDDSPIFETIQRAKQAVSDSEITEEAERILRPLESTVTDWFTQYTDLSSESAHMAFERLCRDRSLCIAGLAEADLAALREELEGLEFFEVRPRGDEPRRQQPP